MITRETGLDDYTGVAICDGYKVYDVLARERENSDLTLARENKSSEF